LLLLLLLLAKANPQVASHRKKVQPDWLQSSLFQPKSGETWLILGPSGITGHQLKHVSDSIASKEKPWGHSNAQLGAASKRRKTAVCYQNSRLSHPFFKNDNEESLSLHEATASKRDVHGMKLKLTTSW